MKMNLEFSPNLREKPNFNKSSDERRKQSLRMCLASVVEFEYSINGLRMIHDIPKAQDNLFFVAYSFYNQVSIQDKYTPACILQIISGHMFILNKYNFSSLSFQILFNCIIVLL